MSVRGAGHPGALVTLQLTPAAHVAHPQGSQATEEPCSSLSCPGHGISDAGPSACLLPVTCSGPPLSISVSRLTRKGGDGVKGELPGKASSGLSTDLSWVAAAQFLASPCLSFPTYAWKNVDNPVVQGHFEEEVRE